MARGVHEAYLHLYVLSQSSRISWDLAWSVNGACGGHFQELSSHGNRIAQMRLERGSRGRINGVAGILSDWIENGRILHSDVGNCKVAGAATSLRLGVGDERQQSLKRRRPITP